MLLNENSTQTALGIGTDYKFTKDLKLGFDIEHTQAMFYHAMQAGVLQIDEVPVMHVHPFLDWTFLRAQPFELRAHAGVSYLGASSFADYSVQSGTGFDIGLTIEQNFKSTSFSCSPTYSERKQNSTILTENQRDLSIGCAFKINLP